MKKMLMVLLFLFTTEVSADPDDLICAPTSVYGRTPAQIKRCEEYMANQMRANSAKEEAYQQAMANYNNSVAECAIDLKNTDDKKSALITAIDCYKSNIHAGADDVTKYLTENSSAIESIKNDQEIKNSLNNLLESKAPLYWMMEGPARQGNPVKKLVVAKSYLLGRPIENAKDLSTLDLQVTTVSKIFGADQKIPFSNFKSMYYSSRGTKGIGAFQLTTADGLTIDDDKYQAIFPIKKYISDKRFAALTTVNGKSYSKQKNYGAMDDAYRINENDKIVLNQDNFSGYKISLIAKDEAMLWINEVEAKSSATKTQNEEKKAQEIKSREGILMKLQSAAKGDEDSCQTKLRGFGATFNDYTIVNCQILGSSIDLGSIKSSGWIVTNVSTLQNAEKTTILAIKKAK